LLDALRFERNIEDAAARLDEIRLKREIESHMTQMRKVKDTDLLPGILRHANERNIEIM